MVFCYRSQRMNWVRNMCPSSAETWTWSDRRHVMRFMSTLCLRYEKSVFVNLKLFFSSMQIFVQLFCLSALLFVPAVFENELVSVSICEGLNINTSLMMDCSSNPITAIALCLSATFFLCALCHNPLSILRGQACVWPLNILSADSHKSTVSNIWIFCCLLCYYSGKKSVFWQPKYIQKEGIHVLEDPLQQ